MYDWELQLSINLLLFPFIVRRIVFVVLSDLILPQGKHGGLVLSTLDYYGSDMNCSGLNTDN